MSNVHVRQTPMSEMCIVYEIIRHVVLLNRLTLLFFKSVFFHNAQTLL